MPVRAFAELVSVFTKLADASRPRTVFVLNYGWAYAGMWQLAKRVLPNTALERILFPSKAELLEFFDEEHLLVGASGLAGERARLAFRRD